MAKDYQIDETDTELILHVPPPNDAGKVAFATVASSASLLFGSICFYLSLAYSESYLATLYQIGWAALWFICAVSLRILYGQLAAKRITFERHVIGIDYRILGIRTQRRWFSVYRVQEWITEPLRNERKILLAIRYNDRMVRLVDTLDNDLWLSLVIRMQRKDFVFV